MANFAVIKDGIVDNIIVANSKEIAEQATGLICIEYSNEDKPNIGLGYSNGLFEQPIQQELQTQQTNNL